MLLATLHLFTTYPSFKVLLSLKEICTVSLDVIFGISVNIIRMKRASSNRSSMEDSLLSADMDLEEGSLKDSGDNQSYFNHMTFRSITSVMSHGVTKQLEFEDLLQLPTDMDPCSCHDALFGCWKSQQSSCPDPSLFRAICSAYGWSYIRLGLLKSPGSQNLDGYGESNKKAPPRASQHHDSKRGPLSHTNNESKRLASSTMMEQTDVRKDSLLAEGTDSDRKRRDSSSDENSYSYTKYKKDEPELKGPIKDFSQYKEYVQEYHDRYDSYCSLNKILESYMNEFLKLGKDLEFASGTERYYIILDQLKESYRQCGSVTDGLRWWTIVDHILGCYEDAAGLKREILQVRRIRAVIERIGVMWI